jgi:Lon protease-like protein
VVGESRFRVEQYLEEGLPYAVAMVEDFADDAPASAGQDQVGELRRLTRDYLETLHRLNDTSPAESDFSEDIELFSFQVSAALEADTEVKQRLLAMRSAAERVGLLLRLLPPLIADLTARAVDHEHARTNGKSHRPLVADP